jgi:hypothetical protein
MKNIYNIDKLAFKLQIFKGKVFNKHIQGVDIPTTCKQFATIRGTL